MSISISDIVQVDIAIAPNAVATDGFGPILFMSREFVPAVGEARVRSYTSLKEVAEDFPTGSIYKAATAWYSQKPTPKTFLVGAITTSSESPATAAKLAGGGSAVLADIKAITAGTLTVIISGASHTVSNLDFSQAADLGAVSSQIQAAFTSANVPATMSQTAGVFTITTTATGSKAVVSSATGNIATALKLNTASNPTSTPGADASGITADLTAVQESNLAFFFVGIDANLRATSRQMTVAQWCQANGKVFGWGDSDSNVLKLGTSNSFATAKAQALRNTICVYDASDNGDEYPEVSIMGRASTVNFNSPNAVIVLAFKQGPGIKVANLSSGQLTALQSYNGNAFIDVGGNAMFWNGKMADGTWFDSVQGVEWLTQQIRNNVFNLFYTSTRKIPWTDTGVAMVNQQVTLALELAVTNGLIAPGYDNEGNFYPDGYKVSSTDLALLQSQKGARIWEGTSFIAIGSGAIQGAIISGSFIQ